MTSAKELSLDRAALEAQQLALLRELVAKVRESNAFYRERLPEGNPECLEDFTTRFPLTTKQDFVDDQIANPLYGSNLTYPIESYVRFHQTSGTTSAPVRWLDTTESWDWMLGCWERIFEAAGLTPDDRVFFPFSFGPFIAFWLAFERAASMGCMAIPGGGLRTPARLERILENEVTFICATPTYALRLVETARETGVDLSKSKVKTVLVAGEPGGSIPATRKMLEEAWPGARVFDHHGLTEVGPVSYESLEHPGILHVIESAFFPEVIDQVTLQPVGLGEPGELVLTNLGRIGSPAIRYRTRDTVRRSAKSASELGSCDLALEGGIIGRADYMIVVRGSNLYPSAVEDLLRSDRDVGEFRVELSEDRGLHQVSVQVERASQQVQPEELERRVREVLHRAFSLQCSVDCVANGTLPRFDAKSRRWVRKPSA